MTPLARWLRRYGVSRLARELRVTRQAPYHWMHGRALPRPDVALRIEQLSCGAVTVRELYSHRQTIVIEKR